MDKKITTATHLKTVSTAIKKFVKSLVGEVAETAASAIEEVENKVDQIVEGKITKIEDKSTKEVYVLSMEDGLLYLDDEKGDDK